MAHSYNYTRFENEKFKQKIGNLRNCDTKINGRTMPCILFVCVCVIVCMCVCVCVGGGGGGR